MISVVIKVLDYDISYSLPRFSNLLTTVRIRVDKHFHSRSVRKSDSRRFLQHDPQLRIVICGSLGKVEVAQERLDDLDRKV